MKAKYVCRDEQIRLIMECRASGLSEYQWCEDRGIRPSTYFNWVSRLRRAGVTIPASGIGCVESLVHQEVVKVNLIPDSYQTTTMAEQKNCAPPSLDNCAAMEIATSNSTIRFFNHTNPELVRITLQCLGGMPHAW